MQYSVSGAPFLHSVRCTSLLEFIAFLLPVAAASGWLAASRYYRKNLHRLDALRSKRIRAKGPNYSLNEKIQSTLELAIETSETGEKSTESRIALGNLFRRSGEVERAIDLHQSLLGDPLLSEEQHGQAVFELGMDFMRAGLFDRAETIFVELKKDPSCHDSALQQLLQIYQHEKDWLNAIECTKALKLSGKLRRGESISQFYCEMVQEAFSADNPVLANRLLVKALAEDPCPRASLLSAEMAISEHRYQDALNILRPIPTNDSRYVTQVVELMTECFQNNENISELIDAVGQMHADHPSGEIIPLVSGIVRKKQGVVAASRFVLGLLRVRPSLRGLHEFLVLIADLPEKEAKLHLHDLSDISSQLASCHPSYRCVQCGFTGSELHWRCPGCHHWETFSVCELSVVDSKPTTD
jgi:lipopolysaccharide biosynthesis regulator YciM